MQNRPEVTVDKRRLFADLGYEPHPGQWQVHRSRAPRRVLACGVRWGKSRAAAMEAIAAVLQPRERSIGWVVAPSYDLADKVFREIVIIAAEHLRHRIVALKEHDRRLVLRNLGGGLSEVRGKSADNPTSLLGEGLDFLIVDEASRLKPMIWEAHLSQRLIDRKGWALLISTPRGKNWYFDLFRRGKGNDPDYESWNYASHTNPHLDQAAIEGERERLPDRVYRQEYLAEFLEGAGQVFRFVRELATGPFRNAAPGREYKGGLDLAKHTDFTALVIMNPLRHVIRVDRFNRIDWSLQIQRVKAWADRYNGARLLVDSTGAGEPVYEALKRAGLSVEGYSLTSRSKGALIDNLALMLERREIVLPSPRVAPVLIDELEAFEYSITDAGNVRTGAPAGMHDDCVIALALAAWQLRPVERPQVYVAWSGTVRHRDEWETPYRPGHGR